MYVYIYTYIYIHIYIYMHWLIGSPAMGQNNSQETTYSTPVTAHFEQDSRNEVS